MIPTLYIRTDALNAALDTVSPRQLPFAMSLGLNLLGKSAQGAMQEGLGKRFELRRKAWNVNAIKIEKGGFATKTSWRIIISLDQRASYLDKFEEEGVHHPFGNRSYVWVPNNVVFRKRIIQAGNPLHPKALHLHRDGTHIIGDQRTFMVRSPHGPLVLQRVDRGLKKKGLKRAMSMTLDTFRGGQGPAQKNERYALGRTVGTRLLYTLKYRVKVPVKLEFVKTITKTVEQQAIPIFREAITRAMSTARL